MSQTITLIATTAFGTEAVTKRELSNLGYDNRVMAPGWVQFTGDLSAICRANLWLRSADRVLIQVASFPADNFDALFETTREQDWKCWIPADGQFPVSGRSIRSQLSSVPACQRSVKKAIAEALLQQHGVSTLPESNALFRCQIALLENIATLTIDTTGPSLHKRGYRQHGGDAPLKETLASTLVQLSFWNKERPLIDPFCGSGTIPIEAAMLGRNIAPGLNREFVSCDWPWLDPSLWSEARTEARDLISSFDEMLIGTDLDPAVLKTARRNAEFAGVSANIHFQQKLFHDLNSSRKHGCLITNPPYGERLSELYDVQHLYESMPDVLRRLPTWSHYILTSFNNFESLLERRADRRRKLYNARIACTYYQFHGPGVKDEKQQPVFGELDEKAREQAELFRRRLIKRSRHLRRWPTRRGITCFRLYEKDIPEIPLVVDRYEDHLHLSEFERPHDRNLAQHQAWLDLMQKTAGEALAVSPAKVFLKRRLRQRGTSQHEHLSRDRYEIEVEENELKFIVNLTDYIDTGLFLDHRETRKMVLEESSNKDFLNLFAYTGSFSVYAAQGRARSTTSVDRSTAYLDWAQRNMERNGFRGPQHRYIQSDIRNYLSVLSAQPQFDLAIIDPPTFSNTKADDNDWIIQDHWSDLINQVIIRMRTGGVIYFATNFRRFRFDETQVDATCREISKQTVPEDFRNRRIHRCWRIVCR